MKKPEVHIKTGIELEMEKVGLKSMAPIMTKLNRLIDHISECPKCNGAMQPIKYKCNKCGLVIGEGNGSPEHNE